VTTYYIIAGIAACIIAILYARRSRKKPTVYKDGVPIQNWDAFIEERRAGTNTVRGRYYRGEITADEFHKELDEQSAALRLKHGAKPN